MIRVVIVDDQRLVREGLAELLGDDLDVVGTAGDGREGIELCRRTRPDVALVDVVMPVADGPACTRVIIDEGLAGHVLALTTYDSDEHLYAMLAAGAAGYILKDVAPADLVAAVEAVHAGDPTLGPKALRRLIDRVGRVRRSLPTGPDELTGRELDVLRHVAAGRSNTEIAAVLYVSESTVKTHIGRLLDKLQCRDRSQLVVAAYETGLVRPGDAASAGGTRST